MNTGQGDAGRWRLIAVACVVLAVSVASVAVAGTDERQAQRATVGKKVNKLKKKVNKVAKKVKNLAADVGELEGMTGPQGEQGPAGPAGPTGAQGPAGGSNVISDLETSTVSTTSTLEESKGGPTVSVTLDEPAILRFSGGYEVDDGTDADCRTDLSGTSLGSDIFFASDVNGSGFVSASRSTPLDRYHLAGTYSFELLYGRASGTDTCQFRNRLLTVDVVQ